MADSASRTLVLRSDSQVALAPSAAGPLAQMISDAITVVEGRDRLVASRPRLLIADGERALVRYLSELLGPHFAVTSTEDFTRATEGIAAREFDVGVASLSLCSRTGIAIYEWIQKTHPDLSERMIFTSDDDKFANSCAEDGCMVLRKPVRLDQWDQALLSVLKRGSPTRFRSLESVFAL